MTRENIHTKDNQEIRDTLYKLSFITFCETIIEEMEAQGRFYQEDIEESQLYKLWQPTVETFDEYQTKLEH